MINKMYNEHSPQIIGSEIDHDGKPGSCLDRQQCGVVKQLKNDPQYNVLFAKLMFNLGVNRNPFIYNYPNRFDFI